MIKNINYQGVTFKIDDKHQLSKLYIRAGQKEPTEVFIPRYLPTGDRIDYLTYEFCDVKAEKIIIDDDIQVKKHAFFQSEVKEVVWPKGCTEIPDYCFLNSYVERVTNIQDVTKIGAGAFYGSCVEEITWPSGCSTIPQACFRSTNLRKITNIDHVTVIKASAFDHCKLESFVWPSNCPIVPVQCFEENPLKSISNMENVTTIRHSAFCMPSAYGLGFSVDLSKTLITQIEKGAFLYCKPENIIMPYYLPDDDREQAFS